jgi:hypothetical protein
MDLVTAGNFSLFHLAIAGAGGVSVDGDLLAIVRFTCALRSSFWFVRPLAVVLGIGHDVSTPRNREEVLPVGTSSRLGAFRGAEQPAAPRPFFSRRLASDFIDESSEPSRLQTGVKTAPAKPENHWRSRQDLNLQPPA